jgi:predicted acyltransferase
MAQAAAPPVAPVPPAGARPPRLHGVDVARGLAVVGMLMVDNRGNGSIGTQLRHESWNGLRLADVVFPVFLLVVGVSVPLSRRTVRPRAVAWRTVKLFVLGWLIVTAKYGWGGLGHGWSGVQPGVLGHIAGAYLLCSLVLLLPRRAQVPVVAAVLALLSLTVVVPVPGTSRTVATPAVSWAAWFDQRVGMGFGAEAPHTYLPSAVTVFIGVCLGRVLVEHTGRAVVVRLGAVAGALLAAGLALGTVLPVNKQIWTPSFVLVTGGIGAAFLAVVHWVVDVRGVCRPFRPAEVLGLNAIVAFVTSELLFQAVLSREVRPAVDRWVTSLAGAVTSAYAYAVFSVVVVWAVCAVLARRGVVVRV